MLDKGNQSKFYLQTDTQWTGTRIAFSLSLYLWDDSRDDIHEVCEMRVDDA